jgi:outer membrane protein TolC
LQQIHGSIVQACVEVIMRRGFALGFAVWLSTASTAAPAAENPDARFEARLAAPLTLEDCLAIALENNLELRIARTASSAAQTTVDEAKGAFLPEFSFVGERTNLTRFGEAPNRDEHLRSGAATVTQLLPFGTLLDYSYTALHLKLDPDLSDTPVKTIHFGINQPLLRGAGWRTGTAAVRAARYETDIVRATTRGVELGVTRLVRTAYYEVIRQAKIIDVSAQAVQRDSQLVLQSRSKLDAGLGTRRDVLSAEIILEQDRGRLVEATTLYNDAIDGLVRVMGLQVGRRIEIAQKDVIMEQMPVDETAMTAKAQRDNPGLHAARLQVERARLDARVAGNARLPQLDLNLSWNKTDDPDFNELTKLENIQRVREGNEPRELDFTAFQGWTALVTLSYPLGNKSLGSAHRRARTLLEQSERNLDDVERQLVLDLRTALRSLDNSVERVAILNKNIEGARNKLEFASVNFQLGRASNLDVVDAQKDLLDAETDYINEVIDYRVQLANIEALIGGF